MSRGMPEGARPAGPLSRTQACGESGPGRGYFFFAVSFLSPLTTALKSAPARNLGTDDRGTLMVAPVAGLRAVRAGRMAFSKTPNPVIATLSPLATVS